MRRKRILAARNSARTGRGGAIITWETYQLGNWDIAIRSITSGGVSSGTDYKFGGNYTPEPPFDEPPIITGPEIPEDYILNQNYPNPFNPSTTIEIGLPEFSRVSLKIYNVLGQEVATLFDNGELTEGKHTFHFIAPQWLPAGAYFVRFVATGLQEFDEPVLIKTRRMLYLK